MNGFGFHQFSRLFWFGPQRSWGFKKMRSSIFLKEAKVAASRLSRKLSGPAGSGGETVHIQSA
jgi:hypothetical protein